MGAQNYQQVMDMDSLEELKDMLGEDIDSVYAEYLHVMPNHIEQIKTMAAEGNVERVKEILHAIKGSSANLGIVAMENLCSNLEQSLKNSETMGLPAEVEQVAVLYVQVSDVIHDMFPGL